MNPLVVASGSIVRTRVRGPRVASSIGLALYALGGALGLLGRLTSELAISAIGYVIGALAFLPIFGSFIPSLTPVWSTRHRRGPRSRRRHRDVASAVADDAVAAFGRSGRSVAAWREELRARMAQAGYRSAASPVETATAVLRSSRATPEQRVGAAVALRVEGDLRRRSAWRRRPWSTSASATR